MKRIKRKKLKQDELVTTINKIVRFIRKQRKKLMAVGIVVLFVIVIFIGFRFAKLQSNKKENQLLAQILKLNSELSDNPEKVQDLEKLAGNGKFTRLGYILLANYWIEKGDFDKATSSLENIKKSRKDIFYYQAQDLLAQIQFKQKNYDKAIDIYKKIEEENPKDYSLDVILFHRAEVHEEKGEIEEALNLYNRVKDEFSQTYYSYEASQKISKLEGKK
jgi:predicted negative regulator of RcsB-dependent stress response